jgi:rubredoxin
MTRLKRYIDSRPRGIVPDTSSINKKVYCPLCKPQLDIQMQYDDLKQVWICPFCGHQANPLLSQITLSNSELKASNDFYSNRKKVFFGSSERTHRRIDNFPIETIYRKNQVYQSLMEANEATNIQQDPDELD